MDTSSGHQGHWILACAFEELGSMAASSPEFPHDAGPAGVLAAGPVLLDVEVIDAPEERLLSADGTPNAPDRVADHFSPSGLCPG